MSTVKTKRWLRAGALVVVACFVGAGGVSLAGVTAAGAMQAPDSASGAGIPIDAANLSPEETLVRSRQMQAQMTATEARIATLQKRAESKKDMVLVNCVSDKLEQLHGHIAVANAAGQAVEAAVARRDDGARAHNFARQIIVRQKVLILGTEAEGCGGEDVNYIGATHVEVDIDPGIPVEDPTIPPASCIPVMIRPPESSPVF